MGLTSRYLFFLREKKVILILRSYREIQKQRQNYNEVLLDPVDADAQKLSVARRCRCSLDALERSQPPGRREVADHRIHRSYSWKRRRRREAPKHHLLIIQAPDPPPTRIRTGHKERSRSAGRQARGSRKLDEEVPRNKIVKVPVCS